MKKLLIIGFLLSFIVSCKKQAATPAPPTTNNVTAPPFNCIPTQLDSMLVGDWALDTTQYYVNGNYITSSLYSDPVNCHLQLTKTEQLAGASSLWKVSMQALDCNNVSSYWRVTSGRLDLSGALYTVVSITNTKLVILYGTTVGSGNGSKYYLHK
jgi:hypothetical protein